MFAKAPEHFMPTIKFVSNSLLLIYLQTFLFKYCNKYEGDIFRVHLGSRANAIVTTPEGFEKVLSSNKQITKVKFVLASHRKLNG